VVIEARNAMIATTATSARPCIDARGTIGDVMRAVAGSGLSRPKSGVVLTAHSLWCKAYS
jgi:hypothetical protein